MLLETLARAARSRNPGLRLQALREAIQPTPTEDQAYEGHAHTVARRMVAAFPESRLAVMGSHSRATANRGFSDRDLMLKLPREEAYWGNRLVNSDTVLKRVREQLSDRYTATNIRRDRQAVVLNFAQGQFAVDIVPAIFEGMVKPFTNLPARPAFLIPNGEGDWMLTSPEAHNQYIGDADRRSGGKLKFVVQMVKFWRDCRTPAYPLFSFHLELLLATDDICAGVMSYQECLREVFRSLCRRACRPLRDPLGISGVVQAAATEVQRVALVAAVERALVRSTLALGLEARGKVVEACDQWDMLFNRRLPAAR
jgi:hypothetical protein